MNITGDYNDRHFDLDFLCSVSSDDIPDGCSAKWTLSIAGPLLDCTLEAHAHMATGVEDTVHIRLVADHTLGGLGKVGGRTGFKFFLLN